MELVYRKAGHLELYRYRDGKRFLFMGVVNSIAPSVTKNTVTVTDGNREFDHTFSAGMTAQITVNLNSFVPELYSAIISGETADNDTAKVRKIEEITVPDEAPYTVTLARTPADDNVIVVDSDNKELTKVVGEPAAAGEYSVNSGVLTFYADDAGKRLVVAYDVTAPATETKVSEKASNDVWRVTVAGEAQLFENENVTKMDNLTIDRAMVSGEVAMPTRQKGEPAGWSFTLTVLPPRPGRAPVTYTVEK